MISASPICTSPSAIARGMSTTSDIEQFATVGAGYWLVAQQAHPHGVLLDQLLLLGCPNLGYACLTPPVHCGLL